MTHPPHTPDQRATPDAPDTSWVDKTPSSVQPFLRLMRADRPIGTWLLVLPCWWGLALAQVNDASKTMDWQMAGIYAVFFALGAFVMRGAGCVYNDIVDRDIDAQVARTANRPLPSGQVNLRQAWALLIGLCLIGLLVLVQFNQVAIFTGLAALVLVAAYPFMKRLTWWPQAWLGLTFNWGILVGWAAMTEEIAAPALLLYLGAIFWTLGYDTIYAHQDKEDDALIGVKSTALRLQAHTKGWLLAFYGISIALIALAGKLSDVGGWFFGLLTLVAAHFGWQIWRLNEDDGQVCLRLFKANRDAGLLILLAIIAGQI